MRTIFGGSACAMIAVLLSACGGRDAGATPTMPTISSTEVVSFTVTPLAVLVQPVADASCPAVPPFSAPFNLLIRENSGVNVFVTEVRLRFTDAIGATMPSVTLPAPMLTRQFGSLLVAARGARTFPLAFGLGCGTDRRGTVFVAIDTRDERGRTHTGEVRVAVH